MEYGILSENKKVHEQSVAKAWLKPWSSDDISNELYISLFSMLHAAFFALSKINKRSFEFTQFTHWANRLLNEINSSDRKCKKSVQNKHHTERQLTQSYLFVSVHRTLNKSAFAQHRSWFGQSIWIFIIRLLFINDSHRMPIVVEFRSHCEQNTRNVKELLRNGTRPFITQAISRQIIRNIFEHTWNGAIDEWNRERNVRHLIYFQVAKCTGCWFIKKEPNVRAKTCSIFHMGQSMAKNGTIANTKKGKMNFIATKFRTVRDLAGTHTQFFSTKS